jgi:hypothetical protein
MPLIITDSTALIGLDRIGHLDILPRFAPNILSPPTVVAEFGKRPDWLQVRNVVDSEVVHSIQIELGAGEAEAIALALELDGALLLIDELRGRKYATHMGLEVIGTFGILIAAKRDGILPAVKPLVDALIKSGFYASESLYTKTLLLAGEALD